MRRSLLFLTGDCSVILPQVVRLIKKHQLDLEFTTVAESFVHNYCGNAGVFRRKLTPLTDVTALSRSR